MMAKILGSLTAKERSRDNLLEELAAMKRRIELLERKRVRTPELSTLSHSMGLLNEGEFRAGNGVEPGSGFSGMRIGYPGFSYGSDTWHIAGVNNDVLQVGISATDGKLVAAGGDVVIDSTGINFANSGVNQLTFDGINGTPNHAIWASTVGDDSINILNGFAGSLGVRLEHKTSGGSFEFLTWRQDPLTQNLTLLDLDVGDAGSIIKLGGEIKIRAESGDGSTGYNYFQVDESSLAPPEDLGSSNEGRWYFRGNKFVIQWNDGGTYQYLTADLQSGAPTFFTRSTTAPSDTIAGLLGLGVDTTLTVSAGAITVTRSYHKVAPQSGSTDNLDTINGGSDGDILVLEVNVSANQITVRDGQGNIQAGSNRVLDHVRDKIMLINRAGDKWELISFANN